MRLLIVEDDSDYASILAKSLTKHNMIVDITSSLSNARTALLTGTHNLILLDRMLPDGDGLELIKFARKHSSSIPIIMLTARGELLDKIQGLDDGADDYVLKPVAADELLARIRAISRRPSAISAPIAKVGNLSFDFSMKQASVNDKHISLQRRQLLILEALFYRHGRTVSRESLHEAAYGFDDEIQSNALDAQISKLRRTLKESSAQIEIIVIRGVGYILREEQ